AKLKIREFVLISEKADTSRRIVLNSDILNMELKGNYKLIPFIKSAERILYKIFPSLLPDKYAMTSIDTVNNLSFNIQFKNFNDVCKLILPEIKIAPNSLIRGNINTASESFEINGEIGQLAYSENIINDLSFDIILKNKLFTTKTLSKRLQIGESMALNNFEFNIEGYNDSLLVDFHWINRDSLVYSGDIAALTNLIKIPGHASPGLRFKLIPSEIVFADEAMSLDQSIIEIDTTTIKIRSFTISKKEQYLNIYGSISNNENDSLYIKFNKVNLSQINYLTAGSGMVFNGTLDGTASLSNIYKTPVFYSSLDITKFNVNNDDLGDVDLISNWDAGNNKINLIFRLKSGRIEPFVMAGSYTPENKKLDFGITLDRFNLEIFAPYISNTLSNLKGRLNANLELKGTLDNPELNGRVQVQRGSFIVNYLNTRYNFTNYFNISKSTIQFEDMLIYDEKGHSATANGTIFHNNFKDINFDVTLKADNFLFLNTTEKENPDYYGTAIASGVINLTGSTNNLIINISAKTEGDTQFYIPLSAGEDISESDFISFVNKTYQDKPEEEKKEELTGMQLNFELEVTPDAEVQIIFDSKVGDIIRAVGYANLKMEINTLGDFNMYGDYIIENGDYLFTLKNVINKRFDIEKGGTIKWNGNPEEANLDLNAVYRLKAPLFDLMAGLQLDTAEKEKYKRRFPVECQLNVTHTITNPEMAFNINVPQADDKVNSIIQGLPEEEKNKQLLSLLILNRFYTPSYLRGQGPSETGSAGAVGVTSSELLSNQLSHWLSQISNDFDIGVNYRAGDEITNDELEVALSTQLFNDRVSINGNVGVGGQQQNTSGLVGDFDVNVKLNKSGKLRLKAFTRSNEEMLYENSPYTQGIGLFFREDFNSYKDILKKN
ncbi:MAG: translocation/assembly module TamB domain-containing protein, partial [Bacteroidia bacterium]|nr:translocation/assembly module TamB domain-containing protein [Bacteroidia bacterium]